jgi:small-conductance mechanosensitive channel
MSVASLLRESIFQALGAPWDEIISSLSIAAVATIFYYIIKYLAERRAASIQFSKKELKNLLTLAKLGIIIVTSVIITFQFSSLSGILASGIGLIATSVVGFASRNTISNLIAGILLLSSRPFKIGDRVLIADKNDRILGDVVEISIMYTKIKTVTNELVIEPNQLVVENRMVNYSGFDVIAAVVKVSIKYDQDRKRTESLLIEAATKVEGVVQTPYPYLVLSELGDFAAIYELRAFTNRPNEFMRIQSEIRKNIFDTFQSNGIDLTTPAVQIRREEVETEKDRKTNFKDSLT